MVGITRSKVILVKSQVSSHSFSRPTSKKDSFAHGPTPFSGPIHLDGTRMVLYPHQESSRFDSLAMLKVPHHNRWSERPQLARAKQHLRFCMVLRFLEPRLHCLSRFLGKIYTVTAAGSHPRNFKIRIVWDPDLLPMNPCDVVPEVGGSIKMKIQRSPAPKEDCHGCKGPHTFSNFYISNFIIFHKSYDVFVFVPLFYLIDTKLSAYLQLHPLNVVGSFNSWMLSSFCIAGMKSLGVTIQNTVQGINISHLGKRIIIFKMPFLGGYVSSLEGTHGSMVSPPKLGLSFWGSPTQIVSSSIMSNQLPGKFFGTAIVGWNAKKKQITNLP